MTQLVQVYQVLYPEKVIRYALGIILTMASFMFVSLITT